MVAATMAVPVAAESGSGDTSRSAVSWSAIIAGGVTAAAISLVLLLLGVGLGLSTVSPWTSGEGTATALGVGALVWLVVTQWIAGGIGGYLTGRLRTRWVSVHDHEVFFRDTAHGFLSWAVAVVAVAALSVAGASAVVGGTARAATDIVARASQGAAEGAARSAGPVPSMDYFVDTLFRSGTPAPSDQSAADARAESGRILLKALSDGSMAPEDRTYLAQLVASRTGLSQPEAEQRVDQLMQQVNAATAKVKETVDAGRQAAATFALASFLSLLIGAFIASVAAAIGGRERDEHDARMVEVRV